MIELAIKTKNKFEIINITEKVQEAVKDVKEGIAIIFVPHATMGIIINESYDQNVCNDILNYLSKSIPEGIWEHDKIDNNAAAHIKSSLIGPSETVIIENGKLLLGTWQQISICEFDGPRERKVFIKVIKK